MIEKHDSGVSYEAKPRIPISYKEANGAVHVLILLYRVAKMCLYVCMCVSASL
jgi:hypothetical protein